MTPTCVAIAVVQHSLNTVINTEEEDVEGHSTQNLLNDSGV